MVDIISFTNSSAKTLEIAVEPSAEYFELPPNKKIRIELKRITNEFDGTLDLELSEDGLFIIYESHQFNMKIYVDDELKYYTMPGSKPYS